MSSVKVRYNISQWTPLRVNYWGITKCGNTSIKNALIEATGTKPIMSTRDPHGADAWVHSERNATYISIDKAMSNGFKNFTVTRNPYDRFQSMFKDIQRRTGRFFQSSINKVNTVDEFLQFLKENGDDKRNVHFKSQTHFIAPKGSIIPSYVFDIKETDKISNFIGHKVKHMNSINKDIELTQKQKLEIYNIYKNDFVILGYEK